MPSDTFILKRTILSVEWLLFRIIKRNTLLSTLQEKGVDVRCKSVCVCVFYTFSPPQARP